MPAKQAINDKLQGSVDTYLRCGGVVNNQVRRFIAESVSEIFLISKYLAKLQARTWLPRALASSFSSVLIYVSQGSIATYARCGWIFNVQLTTNLPRNLLVTKIKSVKIWQNYGRESVAPLFGPPCTQRRQMQIVDCLYHLLPLHRPLHDALRVRVHQFLSYYLTACTNFTNNLSL